MTMFRRAEVKLVDQNGTAYGVKHINNKPRISSMPYLFDIAEGNVANHMALLRFGDMHSCGTVHSDICGVDSITMHWLTAAERLKVSSSSTNDTSAGTGARTVRLDGLDINGAAMNETVTLNGTTAVTTTASFYRVQTARVMTAGSSGHNEGDIVIKNNAANATICGVYHDHNQSSGPWYTVPAGCMLYLIHGFFHNDGGKPAHLDFEMRVPTAVGGSGLWETAMHIPTFSSPIDVNFQAPLVIPYGTDLKCRALTTQGTFSVAAGWEGWIEW